MSFWRGEVLAERLPSLIDPYDESRIDCAAYTLSIGGEVYVTPTSGGAKARRQSIRQLKSDEAFTVPPGQFAFLLTEETVEIPDNALGWISIRARSKFAGLVNVSGFHVDPGFSGRLIFSVFNAGPMTIHLRRGQPIFLLWLADLDGKSEMIKRGDPQLAIPPGMVNGISGKLLSLESLGSRIGRVEREQTIVRWLTGVILAVLLGALVVPALKGCKDSDSPAAIEKKDVKPASGG